MKNEILAIIRLEPLNTNQLNFLWPAFAESASWRSRQAQVSLILTHSRKTCAS